MIGEQLIELASSLRDEVEDYAVRLESEGTAEVV